MSRALDGSPRPTPGTPTPVGAVDPLAGTTPGSVPPGADGDAEPPDSLADLLAKVAAAPDIPLGASAPGALDVGTLVDGCYRLKRKLGAGGMGIVFLAWDEELERDVALKVHRGPIRDRDVQRLGREAKVMARLSHPNVVGVYQVGMHEEMLYVAMEFVDGGTMRHWIERVSPSWRELAQLCIGIAQGLLAAHSVGIVHRDLKPDNVLVGKDGRPRVADFGLARLWEGAEPADDFGGEAQPAAKTSGLERFTVTGAIVGTPAYMSPEQFAGEETGPAADQFSLCVLLYEALCGQRPFEGATSLELAEAVLNGEVRPPPKGLDVPRELVDVVLEGLRPRPDERHESVEVLVRRLEAVLGRRRRRLIVGTGAVGLSIAAVTGFSAATAMVPSACEGIDDPLRAFYDDARRAEIEGALGQAAPGVADEVVARLNAFAAEWTTQRTEACEATSVRKERSELELGLRMACLDRMAARFEGLASELATPGELPGLSVASISAMLPDLAVCEDVDALEKLDNRFASRSARDSSAADRAYVEALRLIDQANARQRFGRADVASLAQRALDLATEHELPVPQLHAHLLLGQDAQGQGKLEVAAEHRREAGKLAAIAGDDAAAVTVMLGRASQALAAGKLELAATHLDYADEYLARVVDETGREDQLNIARVLRGRISLYSGEQDQAIALLEPALEQLDDSEPTMVVGLETLAGAYDTAGRIDDAIAAYDRVYALQVERLGEGAPALAATLQNQALLDAELQRYELALERLGRAHEILDAAEAAPASSRSNLEANLGYVHRLSGGLEPARKHQQAALRMRVETFGEEHPAVANSLDELGAIARLEGEFDESLEHLERALAIRERAFGPRHARAAITLTHLGRTYIAAGDNAKAVEVLSVALEIREASHADPLYWAQTELEMARAVAPSDRKRLEELRESAKARLAGVGKRAEPVLASFQAL